MKAAILLSSLLCVSAVQPSVPVPASEVTLRHEIYRDARVNVFLLDIPPGQATALHRHDRDILSVFVTGGKTRAVFNGAAPVDDTFAIGDVRFRSAGFTHSTENRDRADFLCVIFEFVQSQGQRAALEAGPTRTCGPDQESCVEEKPLLCTEKFCVDDVILAPHAVKQDRVEPTDRMLVAVSDYSLSEQSEDRGTTIHARKTGAVELISAGPARRWTNTTGTPAHYIVVTFHQ
ncbi:MAG: hypothetical protein ACXV7D_08875 [Thermoanaerobaculia bacterium]